MLFKATWKMNIQHSEYVNPATGIKSRQPRKPYATTSKERARNVKLGNRDSFPWARKRRRIMILPSSHASVKKCTRVQHPLVEESGNEGGSGRTSEGWEFHEIDKLSIVPNAPPWRGSWINITECLKPKGIRRRQNELIRRFAKFSKAAVFTYKLT